MKQHQQQTCTEGKTFTALSPNYHPNSEALAKSYM